MDLGSERHIRDILMEHNIEIIGAETGRSLQLIKARDGRAAPANKKRKVSLREAPTAAQRPEI